MAATEKLKEIIIDLRMELLKSQIPEENCIWKYISEDTERNCSCECNVCKEKFFKDAKNNIRQEVEKI